MSQMSSFLPTSMPSSLLSRYVCRKISQPRTITFSQLCITASNLLSLDAGPTGGAWLDDLSAPYSEREEESSNFLHLLQNQTRPWNLIQRALVYIGSFLWFVLPRGSASLGFPPSIFTQLYFVNNEMNASWQLRCDPGEIYEHKAERRIAVLWTYIHMQII